MSSWPAPARDAALHGVAGEFVTRTAPHTESDPMALLIQFLVAFGAAAGRNVHYPVEASRHHLNEYAILIGPSGKGRKGSAWDHVEALVNEIDQGFAGQCISSGLASGEGLIFEVRDASQGDSGAQDKRRLIVEAEFAQILKVLAREGNTLSPVVRNAWDGKPMQTIAKNAPVRATGAHIAIIGHITKDELLRFVSGTELANGFVNRFLLVGVKRSQELPFGGRLDGKALERVRDATLAALRFASLPRQLTFDPEARERWIEVYGPLSRGEEGLLGAATRRAEAHVVRLAAIYATLDTSEQITIPHLQAALAVWRYSLDSARWIFGDTLGDPTADEIWALAKDRPAGVTRSQVRDLFSRNKKAREIDRALAVLEEAGRLTRTHASDGRGRPAEIWRPQAARRTEGAPRPRPLRASGSPLLARPRSHRAAPRVPYPASLASDHQQEAKPVSTRDAQSGRPVPLPFVASPEPLPPPQPTTLDDQ